MNREQLKDFLDEQVLRYNQPSFLEKDPLSIPHLFTSQEDREISGFLAATLAWGQRTTILKNAKNLMASMDFAPAEFVRGATAKEIRSMQPFVHRTFNHTDLEFFLLALQKLIKQAPLESYFSSPAEPNLWNGIERFRAEFLTVSHEKRSEKHLASPASGSSAKRLHMFLRWMVRRTGVDLGIWTSISPAQLSCPLDVHSGRVARELGLLTRKQNDARAVLELDQELRTLDATDPVKYDFALFGLSALP